MRKAWVLSKPYLACSPFSGVGDELHDEWRAVPFDLSDIRPRS